MPLSRCLLLIAMMCSTRSFAAHITIQNPCSNELWLDSTINEAGGVSLGQLTIQALEQARMPFVGHAGGISSINGTPLSDNLLELISDEEMKAYGWCYELDGVRLDVMPDQAKITNLDSRIVWFFGYAHYLRGEWLSMCTPTAAEAPAFICGQRPQ